MEHADVVIVGAGVNGASAAFHLARAGVKRVLVLERRHLGAGATGKSGALVRTHYTNEPETRLAFESLKYFQNWADIVGGDCGFRPVGLMVFVAPDVAHRAEENVRRHRALGIDSRWLSPEDARALDPSLELEDVTGVVYEPASGYADPNATTQAFAAAATRLGVTFRLETEVLSIRRSGDKVTGVDTSSGAVEAPVVLVAAGAWAKGLLDPIGIDLGLQPRTARVTVFSRAPERSPLQLTYIDHINGTWMRPIDGDATLIGAEGGAESVDRPDAFSESVPQLYIDLCRKLFVKRVPPMKRSNVRGSWTGILMQSPDAKPVIDKLPHLDGLYCMTGDSGSSFKTAPAIGKGLAEWMTEGAAKTVDLAPFASGRLSKGGWHEERSYSAGALTVSR